MWPQGPHFSTPPCSLPVLGYGMSKGCPETRCCSTRPLLGPPRPPWSSSTWQPSASSASLPMLATAGTEHTQNKGSLCSSHHVKGSLGIDVSNPYCDHEKHREGKGPGPHSRKWQSWAGNPDSLLQSLPCNTGWGEGPPTHLAVSHPASPVRSW